MKRKNSAQSTSFVILFSIAVIGTFFAYSLNRDNVQKKQSPIVESGPIGSELFEIQEPKYTDPIPTVDTSDWKTYKNEKYGLEFKYKPDWKVGTIKNKDGYYVIQIDPGVRYSNIQVYISENDFYALNGLPAQKTQIAGKEALNLDGMVLGIKDNANYFTFDLGVSLTLKPLFEAITSTIKFF